MRRLFRKNGINIYIVNMSKKDVLRILMSASEFKTIGTQLDLNPSVLSATKTIQQTML